MTTPITHRLASPLALTLSLTLALVGLACSDAPDDSGEELSFRVGGGGRAELLPSSGGGMWVNNGLDDPDVSGVDPAFALSSSAGLAEDGELLLDPELHDTVEYLVECALPAGHVIEKQVEGEWLTFEGSLGLAPEWEDGECDEDCQEWVSACLLARTNLSGQNVSLWMRADHPAIGEGTNLLYPVYEASFFGNLFADHGSQHYCQGVTLVGPLLSQLEGRTCTGLLGASCGFTKYTSCALVSRCQYPWLGGLLGLKSSAVGCKGGALPGAPSFHTISTYVGLL